VAKKKLSGLMPLCEGCRLNMVIPADVGEISGICEGVLQVVREMGIAPGSEFESETALREALANAIKHGCQGEAAQKVQCCVTCEESGEILIVVRDPGPGFQPSEVESPTSGPSLLSHHGRGIYLINQLMDEVQSEREGREIQMRKRGRSSGTTV